MLHCNLHGYLLSCRWYSSLNSHKFQQKAYVCLSVCVSVLCLAIWAAILACDVTSRAAAAVCSDVAILSDLTCHPSSLLRLNQANINRSLLLAAGCLTCCCCCSFVLYWLAHAEFVQFSNYISIALFISILPVNVSFWSEVTDRCSDVANAPRLTVTFYWQSYDAP